MEKRSEYVEGILKAAASMSLEELRLTYCMCRVVAMGADELERFQKWLDESP